MRMHLSVLALGPFLFGTLFCLRAAPAEAPTEAPPEVRIRSCAAADSFSFRAVTAWSSRRMPRSSTSQPSRASIDSSMTLPLVLMVIATKFWFAGSLLARARADNLRREAGKDWVAKLAATKGAAP